MPEAADRHEPGGGAGSSKVAGREGNGGTARNDNPPGDSSGREGLSPEAGAASGKASAGDYGERELERTGGWRDAARRAARRLTKDRPSLVRNRDSRQRGRLQDGSTTHDGGTYLEQPPQRHRGRPYTRSLEFDVDWARASIFSSGLAVGALVGAGIALLTAPQSGSRTRRKIANVGRRAGSRAADAWDGLGDELRVVRAKGRRDVKRGLRGTRREVAEALNDLDQRALEGLRSLRDLRRSRAKQARQKDRSM